MPLVLKCSPRILPLFEYGMFVPFALQLFMKESGGQEPAQGSALIGLERPVGQGF